ncbi:MAG: hypothetical protein U1E61_23085 [Bradyrhizobium sp.]
MNARKKMLLVIYLTTWTTIIAWLTALMISPLFPELRMSAVRVERDILAALPGFTPFIALPIAFGQAMNLLRMLRRKDVSVYGLIVCYFLGTPARIFLAILIVISLLTVIFAPITFLMGLIYGAVPALAGTAIHCLGVIPLLYFLDRPLQLQLPSRET